MDQHHYYPGPGGAQRHPGGFARQPPPMHQGQPNMMGPYMPAAATANSEDYFGNQPRSGGGSKKKRRKNGGATSSNQQQQTDQMSPGQMVGASTSGGMPYMGSSNDVMMNAQETWHPFHSSQGSPAPKESPPSGPGSGKHLMRAKGSGQFSSNWPDEATCALVQQCCVNMKHEFAASDSGHETWQKVADALNQSGHRMNRPDEPLFTADDCKKKWQYIYKEAKKYKRKMAANEQNIHMPKVIAILGSSLQQELFNCVGPVEPAKPSDKVNHSKKKKPAPPQGNSYGVAYFPPDHQFPGAGGNFSAGHSNEVDPVVMHSQAVHPRSNQEPDSADKLHENGEAYSAEDYAHEKYIRERKMLATEVLLTTARYTPEHKVTLSRALKLLETRTETLLKVFDMCYFERAGLDISLFVSYMRVLLAAEDHDY